MFDSTYKSMNSHIKPDFALIESTIIKSEKQIKNIYMPIYKRPFVMAAMILLCIFMATPVLAANIPSIYELMYLVSPDAAQFFTPVQKSCVDNGIRMEVVSTNIHENTAEIYITMQDLTGDRIDETTDLFDSYSIHRSFDSSATCKRVGYDDETKTVTFLIQIDEWGKHKIDGSKLTFSVGEFLSHKTKLEDVPVDIDLSIIDSVSETQTVNSSGGGGSNYHKYETSSGNYNVLVPGDVIYTPIKGLDVTAIGYTGETLHIQMKMADSLTFDNHGFFYLLGNNGNKISSDCSVYFIEGADSNNRADYVEFIFDIPQAEIGNYSLYGSFYTSGMNTKGNWRITFPLTISQADS